jgi:hypothetical protein
VAEAAADLSAEVPPWRDEGGSGGGLVGDERLTEPVNENSETMR